MDKRVQRGTCLWVPSLGEVFVVIEAMHDEERGTSRFLIELAPDAAR